MVPGLAVCTSFMDFQKCKFSGSISPLLNNTLWSQGPAICLLASQVILKQSQQLKAVFELGQQQAMGHPPYVPILPPCGPTALQDCICFFLSPQKLCSGVSPLWFKDPLCLCVVCPFWLLVSLTQAFLHSYVSVLCNYCEINFYVTYTAVILFL